ncbi:hypothetical protein BGW36DRAFT_396540 [Talaromyces proteolyticus]|uniref:Proteasome assembly chaperone 4 n=1 Tax=Talaromyces proteolyticus TaxID=1131652 RepID=A0AAD4KX87_9EURO|nr:uncharacterized protein BGW36DRAFT_396540 [Talaromyces proteolyticus]KAH8698898.1 hypothetical protein BGW36DRAFT_396540 [Talaromyces proteolyticus]
MATETVNHVAPLLESATPSMKPVEISFPLPRTPHTNVHIHLTLMAKSTMVFLSTTNTGDSSSTLKPMGSFVYAMPDRTNIRSTISTALFTSPGSIDYATRTAKILARRMNIPVYVGCNIDPVLTESTIEEEMEGFSKIIDTIIRQWENRE